MNDHERRDRNPGRERGLRHEPVFRPLLSDTREAKLKKEEAYIERMIRRDKERGLV
tara:strand:+ start:32106 stop:32273 length:168 start_codon:yes stop_codon:yes gene_type:complete